MNKLIDSLFEKDSVIKVISILTAILIWFLVLDRDNPFEERTIAVPLTSNIEVLQANNLQIVGTPLPTSIDVKIRGRRQKIMSVTANDFRVSIDLSEVTESGQKRIKIGPPKYLGDQDVIISGMNPSYINLRFERFIGKQYPVELMYQGKLPAGYELVNVKVEPNPAFLEERESSIAKVNKVVAMVNLEEIKDNRELVMRGTVLDVDGQPLRQFDGKVPLIVSFDLVKRIPVAVSTRGLPLNDWYLKEIRYNLPEVRVLGTRSLLDGITRLTAEPLDITGKSGTYRVPLTLTLPKGLSVLKEDMDLLTAEVVIERYATRTISIPASMISIYESDTTGSKEYRVADEPLMLTIKGKPEIINAVEAEDIGLSIRVNGLDTGEHQVPLLVSLPSDVSLVGEYHVKVIIAGSAPKETAASGAPGDNNP